MLWSYLLWPSFVRSVALNSLLPSVQPLPNRRVTKLPQQFLKVLTMPPRKKAKKDDEDVTGDHVIPEPQSIEDDDFKPPAKRGRPKKNPTAGTKRPHSEGNGDSTSKLPEEGPSNSEPDGVEGVKRKRGRPKTKKVQESTDGDGEPDGLEGPKRKRGRPKTKKTQESTDGDEDGTTSTAVASGNGSSTAMVASGNGSSTAMVASGNGSSVKDLDTPLNAVDKNGRPWTLKFSSWNVNGVRAWLKNDGLDYVKKELPDIFCVQETKCDEKDLPQSQLKVDGYKTYWSSAEQKGYSGTGLYCKKEPLKVTYGIGVEEHDKEGRVITAEFERFYFVTTYIPNSGDKLKRLTYRTTSWDPAFRKYLKTLDEVKPVIICGDLNVAHHEIDLANPKTNLKTSGFTVEERESFTTLLDENELVDSFRHLYPDRKDAYSYWSYRSGARKNNKGWRLDYFLVSKRIVDNVCDHVIRSTVLGSDHCPIVLLMTDI